MTNPDILEQISEKGVDIGSIADRLIKNNRQIPLLIEALQTEKRSKKFAYEKTLRLVSERAPGLIYPYFDVIVKRQLKNKRTQVVKKAERFIKMHGE